MHQVLESNLFGNLLFGKPDAVELGAHDCASRFITSRQIASIPDSESFDHILTGNGFNRPGGCISRFVPQTSIASRSSIRGCMMRPTSRVGHPQFGADFQDRGRRFLAMKPMGQQRHHPQGNIFSGLLAHAFRLFLLKVNLTILVSIETCAPNSRMSHEKYRPMRKIGRMARALP